MEITDEDIINFIESFINHKNKRIISKVLGEAICNTEAGKAVLFKAVCGSSTETNFSLHQRVLFNYKLGRTWDMSESESLSRNHFVNRYGCTLARARVIKIKRLDDYPIQVEYKLTNNNGETVVERAYLKEKMLILDSDFHNNNYEKEMNKEFIHRAGLKYDIIELDDIMLKDTTHSVIDTDDDTSPF